MNYYARLRQEANGIVIERDVNHTLSIIHHFQPVLTPRLDLVVETINNVKNRVELPLSGQKETTVDEPTDDEESVEDNVE